MKTLIDRTQARGALHIRLYGPDGVLKDERRLRNLVVSTGKNWMASRMNDASAAVMSYMALGTGAVAPAAGDVALGAEVGRVALGANGLAANVITYNAIFPAGVATGAITEGGIFNAGAGGAMLARSTFAVLNKGTADYMTIAWAITQS